MNSHTDKSAAAPVDSQQPDSSNADDAMLPPAIGEIARAGRELRNAANAQQAHRLALATLAQLIPAEFLSVTTRAESHDDHQKICATLERATEFNAGAANQTLRVRHTMLERAQQTQAPVFFNNVPGELVSDALLIPLVCPAPQSVLCAPLISNNVVTGFIVASTSSKAAYTLFHCDCAETIAYLLAATLARLEQSSRFTDSSEHRRTHAPELLGHIYAEMFAANSHGFQSDLNAIMQRAANALARVLPETSFVLLRAVSFSRPEPLLRAWTPGGNRQLIEIHAPAGQIERAVYTEQRPVLVNNMYTEQRGGSDTPDALSISSTDVWQPLVERLGGRSVCFAPIIYNGQVLAGIGIVESGAKKNRQWTNDDCRLLANAAQHFAPFIFGAQLHQLLSVCTEDLLALLRLASGVTNETELELALRATVDSWTRITGAEATAILRWSDDAPLLRLAAAKNLPAGVLERYTHGITLDDPLCGLAANRRTGVAVDLASERSFAELYNAVRWSGLRGAWATPITSATGKLLGMLVNFSQAAMEVQPVEQRLADLFARPIAVAVQNLSAHQNAREEARTIKHLEEELGHAACHKAEFMSIISHELRTPLNAIIGFAEMLRQGFSGQLNEQQQSDVQIISRSAEQLLGMVEDTLDLARLDSHRFPVYMDSVAFTDVVKRAVECVRAEADTKGLDIELDIAEDAPVIRTDPERVRQILMRLLSNAVKFTDSGTVRVSVKASDAGHVQVNVSDTGVGFDAQSFPQAFDDFRQADSSNTRLYGGTGLGLAVSKRLVQRLGGHIGVTSQQGEGSTFWFQLPPEIPGTDA